MAGTTALAYFRNGAIEIVQSRKKQDADLLVKDLLLSLNARQVFIDAPLSLPSAYNGSGDDYFYRSVDRQLNAMSPMFLGGLTARAMRLAKELQMSNILTYETYPAGLAKEFDLVSNGYKKEHENIPALVALVAEMYHADFTLPEVSNWHQFDALLALTAGTRFKRSESKIYGKASEGLIYI